MCGRFSLTTNLRTLAERFSAEFGDLSWQPRYNLAPSQPALTVVLEGNTRHIVPMHWGLLPPWAKEKKGSFINARSETAHEKRSFKDAFAKRHCLVLCDGFFEWEKTPQGKMPWRASLRSGAPFAMAGIWQPWRAPGPKGEELLTFSVLTTEANPLMQRLHERMPVILHKQDEQSWLDLSLEQEALTPYPDTEMELYRVSQVMNSWKIDEPICIERLS